MFGEEPCQSGPAFEVHNVLLAFLLGEVLGCQLTGESHTDVEAA